MAKMIYVYGKTKEQAEEYICNCVKAVTDTFQLRGHDTNTAVLITLPQENAIVENAKARKMLIVKA